MPYDQTPHENHVIQQGKPAMPGFMNDHPAYKTTAGNKQDNGSSHREEQQPSKTPQGKTMGVVGSAARTAKRKAPRSRTVDGGGKGGGIHQS
jgi:hypothetical protein